jgi:RNA polymerase-binding transcription factor DksA
MHYHYLTLEQRESLERLIRSSGQPELLQRLHTAEYGVCKACGSDIPYVRLLDCPAAELCAACQANSR